MHRVREDISAILGSPKYRLLQKTLDQKRMRLRQSRRGRRRPNRKPCRRASQSPKSTLPTTRPRNQVSHLFPPVKQRITTDGVRVEEKAPTAECAMVKTWRHKLQRAFLSKVMPKVEVCHSADQTMCFALMVLRAPGYERPRHCLQGG